LYLAAIPAAISSVFVREEGGQIPKFQNEQLLREYLDFLDEERARAQLRTAARFYTNAFFPSKKESRIARVRKIAIQSNPPEKQPASSMGDTFPFLYPFPIIARRSFAPLPLIC
jgi:hypothetical protein